MKTETAPNISDFSSIAESDNPYVKNKQNTHEIDIVTKTNGFSIFRLPKPDNKNSNISIFYNAI